MAVKTKIEEAVASELTKKIIALLLPLLSTLVLALVPQVRDRILPVLPKPLLAVLIGLSLSLNLALLFYVLRLRRSLSQKLTPRFGVLWPQKDHVPHCPGCSKPLTNYSRHSTGYGFSSTWGFDCAQCKQFVAMTDDDGRVLELKEAKGLLSGKVPLETPEPDENEMQILTILANAETSAAELTSRLKLRSERMDYHLTKLRKWGYITVWAMPPGIASSRPAMYHLSQSGRELLVNKKLL